MSLCPVCGLSVLSGLGMCSYHASNNGDDWALGNRIMCDFFHRRIVPPRLAAADRVDEYSYTPDVA